MLSIVGSKNTLSRTLNRSTQPFKENRQRLPSTIPKSSMSIQTDRSLEGQNLFKAFHQMILKSQQRDADPRNANNQASASNGKFARNCADCDNLRRASRLREEDMAVAIALFVSTILTSLTSSLAPPVKSLTFVCPSRL